MEWTRKPTIIAGQAWEDDWTVLLYGKQVGRVYRSHLPEPAHAWLWASWFDPPCQGYAPSLAEALEELRRRRK